MGLISLTAFALLIGGRYRVAERVLILLVTVMSAVFLTTMVLVLPRVDFESLFRGACR